METYRCSLGDGRPDVCKEFPKRKSDIDDCGRALKEKSTCVAEIGGKGCDSCGLCCRDKPWPSKSEVPEGVPETKREDWQDPKTKACIWLVNE